MTNITINTKNTKKRGNGMKKILAILLAIITVFAMSIPAFAADETAKDVDNTFDNYTPAPGKTAPENWYDPYCYDEDGRINQYCLNRGGRCAIYCPEYHKIWTPTAVGRYVEHDYGSYGQVIGKYSPYSVLLTDWSIRGADDSNVNYYESGKFPYCPYCGKYGYANYTEYTSDEEYTLDCCMYTHPVVGSVTYGYFCDDCGGFNACDSYADVSGLDVFKFSDNYSPWAGTCCGKTYNINNVKLYRFLTEEQRNAEYSFIFTETEMDFGDGKDGKVEDLEYKNGTYAKWNSEDNPNYKPSFWQKIVNFFASIVTWFQKIFGIVK